MVTTSNQHRFKPWCFLAVSLAIAGCSSKLAEVDPGTPRGVSLPEPSTGAPSEEWSASEEYRRSQGLALIKAAEGYAARHTGEPGGRGKTVAILDEEINFNHPELGSKVSLRFNDDSEGIQEHGTHVAGIVGALRDGSGMHGVAYNADLVGIAVLRSQAVVRRTLFLDATHSSPADAAAGIASAAGVEEFYVPRDEHGIPGLAYVTSDPVGEADIINMSFSGPDPHEQLLDAMMIAARENKIMVAALGNDGDHISGPGPTDAPAIHVTESGVRGNAIAVGSIKWGGVTRVTPDGFLVIEPGFVRSVFSSSCGSVMAYCMFAPGDKIFSTTSDGGRTYSGTSMAAPHVSGAAAVVWAAFPNKDASQIVRRLLDTAEPIDGHEISAIYGHGVLNLENALSPVNFLSVASTTGNLVPLHDSTVSLPPGLHSPSESPALSQAIVYDEQMFPFRHDLTSLFRESTVAVSNDALTNFLASLGRNVFLSLGSNSAVEFLGDRDSQFRSISAAGVDSPAATRPEADADVGYRFHFSPAPDVSVVVGRGTEAVGLSNDIVVNGTRRGLLRDNRSVAPFSALVGQGMSLSLAWQPRERITVDFSGKDGDSYFGSGSTQLVSAGLSHRFEGGLVTGTRLGILNEEDSLLGIRGEGAFGGFSQATTKFFDVSASLNLSDDASLFGTLSHGLTDDRSNQHARGIVSGWSSVRSGSFMVGGELRDLVGSDRLTFTGSQPWRARRVRVHALIPRDETADGIVSHVEEAIDLAPDGRETRFQLMYEKDGGRDSVSFAAGAYVRLEPNHDASADTDYGFAVKVGTRF